MARERGETQGYVGKDSVAGDENTLMELGPRDEVDSRQETFGPRLLCNPTDVETA